MYWDPFDELDRMHEEMDRVFGHFFAGPKRQMIGHKGKNAVMPKQGFRSPMCHLQETENNLIATFEIPGVEKGDIDLLIDDDHLEVKVESKVEKKEFVGF